MLRFAVKNEKKNIKMSFSEHCNKVFNQAIRDYHLTDNVDVQMNNPYERGTIDYSLYMKCCRCIRYSGICPDSVAGG